MKPQVSLPNLKKPFGWDLVTVLDPRVSGRTLQLWLMVREFAVVTPKDAPEYITAPLKRVLVSPMVPFDKKSVSMVRETISFAVVDARYPPQVVELCFTQRQAELFRKAFAPSEKAVPVLTAQEGHPRFKCYIPGCKATSSDPDYIGAHFQHGLHPGVDFDKGKVQVFRINGPGDPATLKTPSPFIVLPPAVKALEGQSFTGSPYLRSTAKTSTFAHIKPVAGSKRSRESEQLVDTSAEKTAKVDMFRSPSRSGTIDGKLPVVAASDPSISGGVTQLVDEYKKKYPVAGEGEAETQELRCICLQLEDGRPMIACSNGESCRLRWYHPECVGLSLDDLPEDNVPWFCPECLKQSKRITRAASLTPLNMTPRKKLKPRSARARAQQAVTRDMEDLGALDEESSDDNFSSSSPSIELKSLSADMLSSFAAELDSIKDYDLTSLASAKVALRARAAEPIGRFTAKRKSGSAENSAYSSNYKSPNCRSWTAEEEQHLKEVVKECADAGLAGEALWSAAHPKLAARGVTRPIGGMKMRWCRGLRDETKIDERRKKNKKLLTAVQKPKTDRNPDAPKKGRFKGKAFHAANRVSGPSNMTTGPSSASLTPGFPAAFAPTMVPATATFPVTTADIFVNARSKVAHARSASV